MILLNKFIFKRRIARGDGIRVGTMAHKKFTISRVARANVIIFTVQTAKFKITYECDVSGRVFLIEKFDIASGKSIRYIHESYVIKL